MRRQLCKLAILGSLLTGAQALGAPAPTSPLPLKRVRFYDSGVGYFERGGPFDASQGTALPVPAGHLDDALKTLVVLSADGETSIKGFEFRSSASRPLALALAGLPPDGDGALDHAELLRSLKGAAAELRTARERVRGRVIEVVEPDASQIESCSPLLDTAAQEQKSTTALARRAIECVEARATTLLVLTDAGEIRRFRSSELDAVEPLDPAFRARLSAALDTLSSRGAQTTRELRLQAARGKNVTLGYVAETPIWRSTYRLVLDSKAPEAALQGWALLHNDTDEDWHQVRVELVNGQPDSFLFPLAAPRYAHRELVTPEQDLSTVPQLLDTTVDNMWSGTARIGRSHRARAPQVRMGTTSFSGHGAGMGAMGYGTGGGGNASGASALLAVGNLAAVTEAEGVEAGALFRYELPTPMELRAHGSALVPFVQRSVTAERIATFEAPGATARSAVHLHNNTPQTLPAGPISVFADGGFAGESALSRTQPQEARIVRFGFDLDVELTQQSAASQDAPRVLVAQGETLTEHFVRTHELSYLLVNRAASERTAYLRLDFVHNAEAQGLDGTALDPETEEAHAIFRIGARQRADRRVVVREGLARNHNLSELGRGAIDALARASTLSDEQRKLLRAASEQLRTAEEQDKAYAKTQAERLALEYRARRLRDTLGALSGKSVDGAEEVGAKLLATEQSLESLQQRSTLAAASAKAARAQARAELRKLRSR